MASTPSASALSAVLRCRRNIWTTPSARLTGTSARDLPVTTVSLWEAFTHGERLVLGRLALSCRAPWRRTKTPKVSRELTERTRVHAEEHVRVPATVCTCPSLCAPRAKVVFVCESLRARELGTAEQRLWVSVRGACVSLTSLLSHFVWGRLLLLRSTGTDPQDEDTGHTVTQTSRTAVDSGPGAVRGTQVTEDRPD